MFSNAPGNVSRAVGVETSFPVGEEKLLMLSDVCGGNSVAVGHEGVEKAWEVIHTEQ